MSALRRDLFERRLWLLLVVLVGAIAAVPVLLLKPGSPTGTPPPLPPSAAATPVSSQQSQSASHPKTVPAKVLLASIPRDPFTSGMPKLASKPAASSSSGASTASSATAGSSPSSISATSTQAAVVSPTPAPASPSPSTTGSAATSNSATTAAVPTTPGTPTATPAWTIYSVSARFGKNIAAPVHNDLAWLTPFPTDQPVAIFMGVMSGGQQAVFALASGVGHQGPGLCRPNHDLCSAILLKPGQTEQLTIPTTSGGQQHQILRLVRIGSTVTHSRQVALKAYERYSTAGLCALGGQEPVLYDPESGTVQSVPKATCRKQGLSNLFSFPQSGS